ncbi:phage portal protein [Bacillus solitudinis]|uniref:phage portal protein n=1 Tax=Bacillus solitudinis TaxID=2014074 RepID=UPI000C23E8CB|nr:phage portal protein [Bacillus solitudinis]
MSKTNRVRAPNRLVNRRSKAKIVNQGYGSHGANSQKKSLAGWMSQPGSALEDIEHNIEKLRDRSRDLFMGAPLATGALKAIRTSVIGTGLKLNTQIDYDYLGMSMEEKDAWETKVEREFSLWADSIHCDAQRMNNFYSLQQLAFLSWLLSGDSFVLLPVIPRENMPYDIRVQILEADRVSTPKTEFDGKIVNGVEIGKYGEVVAYHIAQKHPHSTTFSKQEWVRVSKFGRTTGRPNILHLMESERPEQRRGVPILAPVIESLKQLARYSEAELMAAVVSGMFTVFIKSNNPDERPMGEGVPVEDQVGDMDEGTYQMGNGSIVALADNEDVVNSNPGRPNTAFDGFVTSICRQIGAALELPYEILLKHFTSSYSASRGALLEAWKMYRMRRSWMAADFCQPIYEEWLAEGIAKGRIEAPGFFEDPVARKAYCGAEWNGPSQGQLDPLKEVNAATKRIEEGLSTRTQETVELGNGDFFRNHSLRVVEENLRREGGVISNGQTQYAEPIQQNPDGPDSDEQ